MSKTAIYSKPVEIDGKWNVTITDMVNASYEERKVFASREKAERFIQKAKTGDTQRSAKAIDLTEEQEKIVSDNWDKMEIAEIVKICWPEKVGLSGHSPEWKSVKSFIARLSPDGQSIPKPASSDGVAPDQLLPGMQLQDHHKATIDSLMAGENPPAAKEIFHMLFPQISYAFYRKEYRAIVAYMKQSNEDAIDLWEEPTEDRRYKAPKNYPTVIGIVNRYVSNPIDPSRALYDPNKIKPFHEKNLKALLSYMQSNTFVFQASQYDKRVDRELFESTFVRQVQDKATDVLPEEVDTYIAIAATTVQIAQLERDIIKQQKIRDEVLDGDVSKEDGAKTENRAKLSMSLVESIKTMQTQLVAAKKHRKDLIESVAGARKERIETRMSQKDNLSNLIEIWINEKTRLQTIALAQKEHEEDAAEMERISSLDDLTVLIAGMTKEEARLGLQ